MVTLSCFSRSNWSICVRLIVLLKALPSFVCPLYASLVAVTLLLSGCGNQGERPPEISPEQLEESSLQMEAEAEAAAAEAAAKQ